jgi:DNA-binding CsgD family transcriptional regulator
MPSPPSQPGSVAMSLTLSAEDLVRVETSLRTLLSPLEHADPDAWRQSCLRAVRELTGMEKGFFWLGDGAGGGAATLQEVEERAIRDYADYYVSVDMTSPIVAAATGAQVWNRMRCREVLGVDDGAYLSSEVYNDWFHRYGMDTGIAAVINDQPGAMSAFVPASHGYISLYHRRPDEARDLRNSALLRMIMPALRAGITTSVRLFEQKQALTRTLDEISEGLMVCDRRGGLIHLNAAAKRMIDADPEGVRLRGEMEDAGRAVATLMRARKSAAPAAATRMDRDTRTCAAAYRIRGALVASEALGPGVAILVALERTTAALPGEDVLRDRFGLTRKEAKVALRMAAGRSNEEIAREFFISPNTARHHAEQVRLKLGVKSKAEIALTLLRA